MTSRQEFIIGLEIQYNNPTSGILVEIYLTFSLETCNFAGICLVVERIPFGRRKYAFQCELKWIIV